MYFLCILFFCEIFFLEVFNKKDFRLRELSVFNFKYNTFGLPKCQIMIFIKNIKKNFSIGVNLKLVMPTTKQLNQSFQVGPKTF